jgi:serine/threonine-protein kinase
MGSVHYTSPEQARGGYSDAKSDIYSLGITLFEMLTGRVPFNGDTTVAIAIKHIQEDLPSPVEYNPEIPISVEKIVLKCCQKSPDRRYQSAAELIADLKRSLITPDKDFVNLVDPDEEGATRVASEEEVAETSERLSDTEQMRLKADVMGEYDEDDRYDDYDGGRRKKRSDYDEMDDLYDYDRPRNRNRRSSSSNQGGSKIEKMTIIMAIISAALVGFIVLLLLGRSLGLFGASDEASQDGSAAQSITEDSGDNADGIQIPDVTGKTYAEAVSILQDDKGFKVSKEADSKNTAAKDTVVSTSPSAGERAKSGSTIKIFVSDGSNYSASAATTEVSTAKSEGQVTVPNIIGMTSEDAVITLVEAGLEAGSIVETSNEDSNLTGLICAQSIAVGTSVSEGTKINMELSTGPASVTYSYNADISAPTEGENFNYGIPVKVTLVTSDGTTLLSTTTSDFPVQGTYKGITAPTGTITFVYTATTPTTTNPDTGETTGGDSVEYTVTRAVTFTQEN